MLLVVAAAGLLHLAATKGDLKSEPGKDRPAKPPVPKEMGAKAGSAKDRLDLPIPKNEPQKGLKIPIYDLDGKLKMNFQIGVATWIDDSRIKMAGLRIETFKDDGSEELDIDLPDSVFNTKTREVSSEKQVMIKRADCQISGKRMLFDTETKVGKLSGGVRMLVYNLQVEDGAKPARTAPSSTETKPEKGNKK